MKAQRIGDYHFFVPDCALPADLAEMLEHFPEGCPMLDFLVGSHTTTVLGQTIQIVPRDLSDFLIEPAVFTHEGKDTTGLVFRLPDDIVRVMALSERDPNRPNYSWKTFWKDYERDLAGLAARLVSDWVKKTLIDGVQAQVQTDIRLGFDQIGFAPRTFARLMEHLRGAGLPLPTHSEVEHPPRRKDGACGGTLSEQEGLWLLNQRYPVASPEGARWTQTVSLPGNEEGLMYVNPEAWNDLQGGDSDGDGGYDGMMGEPRCTPVEQIGPFPGLVMDRDDDEEETHEAR